MLRVNQFSAKQSENKDELQAHGIYFPEANGGRHRCVGFRRFARLGRMEVFRKAQLRSTDNSRGEAIHLEVSGEEGGNKKIHLGC